MARMLRTNVLANYAGQGWVALMAIAFVPFYSRELGIEAFGLVGLMLSLQAMSLLLDLGLGGVMNRELARRAVTPGAGATMRTLVRTLEWFIWPSAAFIAIAVTALAPWLAADWLHLSHLSATETTHAIILIGVAVALQWPASFYTNGLSGLERQPTANAINAAFATIRSVGAAYILAVVSSSISAFMAWYAVTGAAQSATSAILLWKALPAGPVGFRTTELRDARKFAGGLFLITSTAMMLTQLDRVILSALRPLEEVGYFTLAVTVAAALGRVVQPIFNAVYPRFSRLIAAGDSTQLSGLYHSTTQYLVVVIAAFGCFLVAFAEPVVFMWTGNAVDAHVVAMPLAILVVGSALNGLMNLPYALQLAHGWTSLTAALNAVALAIAIPVGILVIEASGLTGAAYLWLATNGFYVLVGLPLMHRRLLPGQLARWYRADLLPPLVSAAATAFLLRMALPIIHRDATSLVLLALAGGVIALVAVASAPIVRDQSIRWLRGLFRGRHGPA
jgi:O-antigen/teichoic acid export membrane protein